MARERKERGGGFFSRVLVRVVASVLTLAVVYLAIRFGVPGLFERLFSTRQQITNVTVERRLESIGELATYAMTYSGHTEARSARQVFGLNVPGTRNSVEIAYSGTIKAGYVVADIRAEVDAEAGVIRIALPEVKVISNAIDEDTLQYVERNNIFNPIRGDAAAGYLEDIRKAELEKAVKMGLYDKARENAEAIIRESLAQFSGYTVAFE